MAWAKRVSVIIPFFQREPGILTRCLQSVRRQHVPPGWGVDVIVVDDGSPAGAGDELRGLEFPAPFRVTAIRQENRGVGAARNRGLEEAGEATLIAFLDSDDTWPATHLERAIRAT